VELDIAFNTLVMADDPMMLMDHGRYLFANSGTMHGLGIKYNYWGVVNPDVCKLLRFKRWKSFFRD
jgi:hypothetical protein